MSSMCSRTIAQVMIGAFLLAAARSGDCPAASAADRAEGPALQFDSTGAAVGEQLPNLPVYGLDGTVTRMDQVWNQTGALLLTSSFTCPKSRIMYPRADELARQIGDRLPVKIIYVLEAHPKGDPSPYRGYEDVTTENLRDGILCRQPTTLAERLRLAARFKDRVKAKAEIFVDGMDNRVWKSMGGGPNMAVLVDGNGVVIARQGWFDAPSMRKAMQTILDARPTGRHHDDPQTPADRRVLARLESDGIRSWDLKNIFRDGDVAKARKLLVQYPELIHFTGPLMKGNGGRTLLDEAAEGGNAPVVELLLQRGADPNAQNHYSAPPLHLAAAKGHLAVVSLLVEHGADVNLKAGKGPTAIQEAAIYLHSDVVNRLLKAGAKPNLFSLAATGDVEGVAKLLDEDVTRAQRPDGWDRTPMVYAAAAGQIEVLKLLVSYGVKDDQPADSWKCDLAIHWAARQKQNGAVTFLLDSGGDINAKGTYEQTLVQIATDLNDASLLKLLLARKPDLQSLDMQGLSALHNAAASGSPEMVEALIDGGADPNVTSDIDHRPCGLFTGEAPRQTPLQLAAESAKPQIIKLLVARGAAIDQRDAGGNTALHTVLNSRTDDHPARLESLRALIAAGANVNATNQQGQTPLDRAKNLEDPDFVKFLEEHGAKVGKSSVQ